MAIATRETSPSHLLLKIESFSSLDKYESPEFHAGNNKWKLTIYNPNGHGSIKREVDYVSVFLAISGTDSLPENWEVNAVFSIFILNQISGNYQYYHTAGNTRRFFGLKTEWGVPNFMSKGVLMNPSNGYLINDSCVFGAEVFVIDNIKVVTRCLSLKGVQVPYKHTIKISDLSTLKQAKIWNSEEFNAGGYKWNIKLNLNGDEEEAGGSLSVYLMYATSNKTNSDERMKAHFSVCLKNQLNSNKNCKHTYSNWYHTPGHGWGWRSFIFLDELNAACGGFIVKDTCIFEVEVSVQARN